MYARERVDEVVNFVLDGHNVTQASEQFNCSRKTINVILDTVRKEDGYYYDEITAQKIKLVLDKLLLEARALAGAKSTRKPVVSEEDELTIYQQLLGGVPLRTLASEYGCSHTTISNIYKKFNSDALSKDASISSTISEKQHLCHVKELLQDPNVIREMPSKEVYDEITDIYKRGK